MTEDYSDVVSVFALGVRLVVRAKPGLSRPRAPRLVDIGDGKRALEVTVKAAAEDGKANQAILEQLADILDIRKGDLSLKSGATGRLKLVEINGDAEALMGKLEALLKL